MLYKHQVIAFFDEKPLVTKTRPKPDRWKKNFLKKRIRRDRLDRGRSPCPQAVTPPAFLFLISYNVKQLEPKFR